MLNRWLMWLASFACLVAVLFCIRLIHVVIGKVMPDSKFKHALLRDRRVPDTAQTMPGQTIAVEPMRESYMRRSARLTWQDPHFRRGISIFASVLAPALVAGLAYGLYLVLAWLKIVN
jgi:hypothetical protein